MFEVLGHTGTLLLAMQQLACQGSKTGDRNWWIPINRVTSWGHSYNQDIL